MSDKHDRFQLLKSKYLEQVRAKERELVGLKAKLQVIQELEAESETLNGSVVSDGKYHGVKLTQAVLDSVQTLGVGGGVTASGVARDLLAQGFEPGGDKKNFVVSVGTTLKRLANKQKQIKTTLTDGNRLYMP